MTCKYDKCKHYEFWDSSYMDDDGIYNEHIVHFCHKCDGPYTTQHCCEDCITWEGYEAKHQCAIKNNVIILTEKLYQKYIDYVNITYGKKYLSSFKNKK